MGLAARMSRTSDVFSGLARERICKQKQKKKKIEDKFEKKCEKFEMVNLGNAAEA